MLTYGDKSFTWNTGRNLESIVDGDNEYSYTYDENGIRTSKTVNGVTTYYNTRDGVILSQTDGTNTMYFQYDTNGSPLGFIIYNGIQYFYLTNQMGDVISITDAQGNELVQYEYDAWGKITSVGSTNSYESYDKELANINPLRYRGYYLDSETGYYYLQSRYYDPSICRFINADIYSVLLHTKETIVNCDLFSYCNNSPLNYSDNTGTMPGLLATSTIVSIIITLLAFIGISYVASYILGCNNFTPAIKSIKDLCENYVGNINVAIDLIKCTINTAYRDAKNKISSISKASSAALTIASANAKILSKVKHNSKQRYWNATLNYINVLPYILIGSAINYSKAKSRVNTGGNVISVTKSEARTLTNACGGIHKYHNNNQHDGYFAHYHPLNSKKVHVWFVY